MLNELIHLVALVEVITCEKIQSFDDLVCAIVDHLNDILDVDLTEASVLREILVGIDGFRVDDLLSIDCDDLVSEDGADDVRELKKRFKLLDTISLDKFKV